MTMLHELYSTTHTGGIIQIKDRQGHTAFSSQFSLKNHLQMKKGKFLGKRGHNSRRGPQIALGVRPCAQDYAENNVQSTALSSSPKPRWHVPGGMVYRTCHSEEVPEDLVLGCSPS